jgi:hypothetical protein
MSGVAGTDLPPSFERAAEGDLVGVLQVPADREAGRETGDPQAQGDQQAREVRGGRLALDVGVGREDHLGDLAVGETAQQLLDPQVVRADVVDRVDRSAEHVVLPAELSGALDGDDVLGLLDHADHRG